MDRYREFEDAHRGSVELIRARLTTYLPLLDEVQSTFGERTALDIGCGRGEWLGLLIERGWSVVGVDSNPSMAEIAAADGRPVVVGDAIDYLRGCAASSLALVTAFHVVEHLERQVLADLLAEIERVLVPGGIVILETPNPENLTVASWSFLMDPTHKAALPPHLLAFFVQAAGLENPAILRLNSQTTTADDEPAGSALLGLFVNSPDYSVIAAKPGSSSGIAETIARFATARTERSPADLRRLAAEIGSLRTTVARTEDLAHTATALTNATAALKEVTERLSAIIRIQSGEIASLQSAKAQLEAEVADLRGDLADTHGALSGFSGLPAEAAAARQAGDQLRAEVAALAERLSKAEKLKAEITGLRISDDRLRERIDSIVKGLDNRIAAELQDIGQSQQGLRSDFLQLRLRHEELAAIPLLKLLVRARNARRAAKRKIKGVFAREAPLRVALRRIDRLITRPIRNVRDRLRPPRQPAATLVQPGAAASFFSQTASERLAFQRLAYALEWETKSHQPDRPAGSKPRLAFVSPLPPERSGIADYSAQILPELTRHYDIDVVVAQESVSDEWVRTHCTIRSAAWFEANAALYDRILYHFGNSPFHIHMFPLLEKIPGIIVLHDFYISDVILHIENYCGHEHELARSLVVSHGYEAVIDRFAAPDIRDVLQKYPANFKVLAEAQTVIVHNHYARTLANHFYPQLDTSSWHTIPLVRYPASTTMKAEARHALGYSDDDVLVCSFGFVHHSKLCDRLLDAWLQSDLVHDPRCHLIFVGELLDDAYGEEMRRKIDDADVAGRIRMTGFVPGDDYHRFLRAADVGVQLRGVSRGETSAAALDCLAYGLATIVNANGSMAEIPSDCVVQISDAFETSELIEALTTLCANAAMRSALGQRASDDIAKNHHSALVAQMYRDAIETAAATAPGLHNLATLRSTARHMIAAGSVDEASVRRHAADISREAPLPRPCRRLFVDVSVLVTNDMRSGIQRVVRGVLLELLRAPPPGYRVEPVRLSDITGRWRFYLAHRYAEQVFTKTPNILIDEPVEVAEGDIFLGADFHTGGIVQAASAGIFREWRQRGARISFIVYDILPLTLPNCFPPHSGPGHRQWILTIADIADDLVCISASVASATQEWLQTHANHPDRLPAIHAWTLGADIDASHPTKGMPENADALLDMMRSSDCFLMVGTVEPRKGHLQALNAFELLWAGGSEAKLIIVGKEGWRDIPREHAQTLPELLDRLRPHPELGKRLFWLQGMSDEFLDRIYQEADCLIAASLDEGFGLPLIEAARHGIPIIARDIPVFREVAGDCATYFSGDDGAALAGAIGDWLIVFRAGLHPQSSQMRWLTWAESTKRLKDILIAAPQLDADRRGAAPQQRPADELPET
ncbi:glycosyltransferase [Xanthobacter pseudotagetidis]|uniref:glycosyltransferase n=1 Tax=Xanthobacter pseudotagetidis TaxID=3119911 RepID=UPI00372BC392